MAIEQGKLGRLNDTNINVDNLSDGKSLVYNGISGKWEPKEIIGGGTGVLGLPSDGSWEDGAINFQSTDTVVDAIDDLNEVLGELVPEDALPITNIELNSSNEKVIAKVVNGIGEKWADVEGTQISNVSNIKKHKITLENTTTAFANADKGIIRLFINDQEIAKIDLGINFNETLRKSNQDINAYNTQGEGDVINNGIVTFSNGQYAGNFKIVSVGKYNNFSKWQKGVVEVNLTSIEEGKNVYKIVHSVTPTLNLTTAIHTIYYDANTINPSLEENTAAIVEKDCTGKYISGIKYYTIGDTFDVSYTVNDAFKTVYHNTKVSEYSMPGIITTIKNPETIPTLDDQLIVNEVATINENNILSKNAMFNITIYDPYGNIIYTEFSENRLVSTYGNVSTKVSEMFRDEQYRLPLDFDFESKTNALTGNWNSQEELTNGNALIYFIEENPALVYPNKDFSIDILPVQTANYSTFTGEQSYVRAFEGENKGNATFTLTGLSDLNDVKIEIKLPGMSGWGNALLPYDSAVDKTQDGWGMLQGSATKTKITTTFGGLNTADTNGRIYVKITLLNQNASLQGISVGW